MTFTERMKTSLSCAAVALLLAASSSAMAADKIKLGYVNTFSGPAGIIGKHYRDAIDLALKDLDGKLGGLPVEIVYGDDQFRPEVAKTVTERLIQRDKVDFLAGYNFTNTLLGALDTAIAAEKIVVSSNASPASLGRESCSRYFFSVGHQHDGAASEAMGIYLSDQKVENLMLLAPNYQAGREVLDGLKRTYKGTIVNESYTQLTQNDFAAELSQIRAAAPKAVFVFLPGAVGINFMKQWSQSGLGRTIPLYSVYTVDHVSLPAIGESALGALAASEYSEDYPNPTNQKFAAAFEAAYGYKPSVYSAKGYDTMMYLDQAVRDAGGKIEDTDVFIKALENARFPSVRGEVSMGRNHMLVQDFVLTELVKLENGSLGFKTVAPIVKAYVDPEAGRCKMQ